MDPTHPDLFRALGLIPLDEFIASSGTRREAARGATTWMKIAIVQHLLDGKNALLVCDTSRYTEAVARDILGLCKRASLGEPRVVGQRLVLFKNRAKLKWKQGNRDVVQAVGFTGKVFNDALWHDRAYRRSQGPYAMIRTICLENGEYLGVAEEGEIVMEFTRAGAYEFIKDNPEVSAVGFGPPPLSPMERLKKAQHESWSRR